MALPPCPGSTTMKPVVSMVGASSVGDFSGAGSTASSRSGRSFSGM